MYSGKIMAIRTGRSMVALGLAVALAGCAGSNDPFPSASAQALRVDGKADNASPVCGFARDSAEHQAYCQSLSRTECEADAECYFQHSIALYGNSFCAAIDMYDCEEVDGCDVDIAYDARCLEGSSSPEPEDDAPVAPVEPEPAMTDAPAAEPETSFPCTFDRGSQTHVDYCDAKESVEACDADPACRFQHSIPLYGGSFCAPQDEAGPASVTNAACGGSARPPQPQMLGDIIITEIMRDPAQFSDADGEWVEIFNPTAITWSLEGCVLGDRDRDAHTLGALEVGPESLVVLASSANPGFTPDYVYSGVRLANEADEVVLTCAGVEIAAVAYDASWPGGVGQSMELTPDAWDEELNDAPSAWCAGDEMYGAEQGTPHRVSESAACQ